MGVVYKAQDTKLDRPVALKFLPAHLLGDEQIRKRFEREAKASAALSHSNVCTVHEIDRADGNTFIAMEFIEGESLDNQIAQGPLKLDEALDIAQQIAKGLEAAHKKGVVHRDIKPQNIMVGEDGHVTIMDFGLAQLTQASLLTRPEQTLGTTFYMSPEQTEGSGTDHRTDIWALGVVIYEMVTGQRPFKGDYDKAVMYSILNEEPEPITALRTGVPTQLEHTAGKCMAKAVDDRYGSAAEVGRDLRRLATELKTGSAKSLGPGSRQGTAVTRAAPSSVQAYLLTAVISGVVGAIVWAFFVPPSPGPPAATRLHLNLPGLNAQPRFGRGFTLSPDGRTIAFVANGMLNLRELGSLQVKPIPGTEDGYTPFFSPDGEWLGFLTVSAVKKVSMKGGPPITLANVTAPGRAVWGSNGDIIIDTRGPSGLLRVSAAGGEPAQSFTTPSEDEIDHSNPDIMPDGDTVTFGALPDGVGWEEGNLFAQSLTTGERKLVISGRGGNGRYAASGHLIHQSGGTLMATPFDTERMEPTGERVAVVERVSNLRVANSLAFSSNGTLVYLASDSDEVGLRTLVWVDRQGREEAVGVAPDSFRAPRLSPDGAKLVAIGRRPQLGTEVLVYDLKRKVLERTLAQFEGNDNSPIWSAEGDRVFYVSDEAGGKLMSKFPDGSGQEALVESWIAPQSVSRNGSTLVYLALDENGGRDIGIVSLDRDSTPRELLAGPALEESPAISPDGRFLAYASTESGRSEIYVSPFPNVEDGRWTISRGGGIDPAWSPDGSELYFLEANAMMASRRESGSSESWSTPVELFEGDYITTGPFARQFDVAPDGRFLMIKDASGSRPEELTIVLNWFEELKRLESKH